MSHIMSTTTEILEAPLWRRLAAWADERFPPENGVVVLLVSAVAVLFGRALAEGGEVAISAADLGAFLAAWAYFLLLRVFDEHKDFDRDMLNHPHRVLQSGRIELRHLKALGAASIVVQAAVSFLNDGGFGPVTGLWLVLIGWTLLMAKEFFLEWPPERFLLYAFMHMISMPLAFLWLAQMSAGGYALEPGVRWLVVLGGLIAAAMEVGRKFRAPAEERATIDSYTKELGVKGASVALVVIVLSAAGMASGLLSAAVDVPTVAYAALALTVLPSLATAVRFAQTPSAERAKQVEVGVGITVLLMLAFLIGALLLARGVA
jgi:4-hydroxybenzoate polyprenyltransferase